MAEAARRQARYEDLLLLPAHKVGEIIGGELIVSPRPAVMHARAATKLHGKLDGPFDRDGGGPGGWWLLFEPELHLGADILVPDLAGWRRERLPSLPNGPHIEIAPAWICEVLSPSTAALDRADKLRVYGAAGVEHAWLVDPAARTLEVLRREGARWMLAEVFKGDARIRAEPFEAVEIELGALWLPAS